MGLILEPLLLVFQFPEHALQRRLLPRGRRLPAVPFLRQPLARDQGQKRRRSEAPEEEPHHGADADPSEGGQKQRRRQAQLVAGLLRDPGRDRDDQFAIKEDDLKEHDARFHDEHLHDAFDRLLFHGLDQHLQAGEAAGDQAQVHDDDVHRAALDAQLHVKQPALLETVVRHVFMSVGHHGPA